MNYIKALEILGKLVKSGQIKSVDEAVGMLQKMGTKVDGLLKQGVENLFKTTKARNPGAFKGWTPSVIEGGKGKTQGVGNLFKETKDKAVKFYDDIVEESTALAKRTGKDVRGLIEERIGYKFTGKESMDDIITIVREKFFKADGGRIGFRRGGRGRQDPMGGHAHQTAAEMRAAAPDQFGGGMNIDHGGGRDDPPPVETRGGKLNISPVVTYGGPYDQIENVGFRGNIGKLMAAGLINLEDAITTGNIDPAFAANLNLGNFNVGGIKDPTQTGIFTSGNMGPVNVSGSYQDFEADGTFKNIGANTQIGNFNFGADYNFENNPTLGLSYNNPDAGLSGSFNYNFEGSPQGMISLSKKFKKGGRVGYGIGGAVIDKVASFFFDEEGDPSKALQRAKFEISKFIGGMGTDLETGAEWYNKLEPEEQQEIIKEKMKYRERGELGGIPVYDEKYAGKYGIGGNYADGGRIGYDIGGLTGQAKNIYDSWISAGHSEEDVLAYLESRGMYNAADAGITSTVNTPKPIIPQGDGGDGGAGITNIDRGLKTADQYGSGVYGNNFNDPDVQAEIDALNPGGLKGLIQNLMDLPTPMNLVRKGINKFQDWRTQQNQLAIDAQQKAAAEKIAKAKIAAEEARRAQYGPINYGVGSDGQQSYDTGLGFGVNATTGGPVSNRTGRGRTDWADGGQVGLATMFTRRR